MGHSVCTRRRLMVARRYIERRARPTSGAAVEGDEGREIRGERRTCAVGQRGETLRRRAGGWKPITRETHSRGGRVARGGGVRALPRRSERSGDRRGGVRVRRPKIATRRTHTRGRPIRRIAKDFARDDVTPRRNNNVDLSRARWEIDDNRRGLVAVVSLIAHRYIYILSTINYNTRTASRAQREYSLADVVSDAEIPATGIVGNVLYVSRGFSYGRAARKRSGWPRERRKSETRFAWRIVGPKTTFPKAKKKKKSKTIYWKTMVY